MARVVCPNQELGGYVVDGWTGACPPCPRLGREQDGGKSVYGLIGFQYWADHVEKRHSQIACCVCECVCVSLSGLALWCFSGT